jgi:hypothetical protein
LYSRFILRSISVDSIINASTAIAALVAATNNIEVAAAAAVGTKKNLKLYWQRNKQTKKQRNKETES